MAAYQTLPPAQVTIAMATVTLGDNFLFILVIRDWFSFTDQLTFHLATDFYFFIGEAFSRLFYLFDFALELPPVLKEKK